MKKIILLVIILIFLTGCGIFNLGGWLVPDDLEFAKLVGELDTPIKISNYMVKNFIYEIHEFYAISPYELWETKKGDCNDFAAFGIFVADCHNYETYMIRIFYSDTFIKHAIAVYVEDEGLSYTGNRWYYNDNCFYFDTFREVIDWDCGNITFLNWRKYKVYDYWNEIIEEEFK